MTTAEIISIGTELLLGETIDTNTSYIARRFREMGIDLYRTQIIGDNVQRVSGLIREALERADFVITTGGLGPTIDDPTRDAAADATGRQLEFHSAIWEKIVERISLYGRKPTGNQKKQAYLPQNALPIHNPVGTAPGFIIEINRHSLICLPGVPHEMETLLNISVVPYLRKFYNLHEIILVRTVHTSGIGEGSIDEQISDLERLTNPTVGLSAHSGIVSIRMTAKSDSAENANMMIEKIERELRGRLRNDIFGIDGDSLEVVTLNKLMGKEWALVTVELNTDGVLYSRLHKTNHPSYKDGIYLSGMDVSISERLKEEMKQYNAEVGVGLNKIINNLERSAIITLITPVDTIERLLKFGGHPENFSRWTTNMTLDLLRRVLP